MKFSNTNDVKMNNMFINHIVYSRKLNILCINLPLYNIYCFSVSNYY